MINFLKSTLCLILIIWTNLTAVGAINVRIKADTTKACAPAQINFSDSSTSNNGPIVYWNWNFGNGGSSLLQHPSRAYPNSGLFTITLKVSDGIDTVTRVFPNYLEILKGPTAQFSYLELTKCIPVNVNFTDNSVKGDGKITRWEWDFGDLTPKSNLKNPSHGYLNKGTYSVILKVIDTNGCQNEAQLKNIIVVDPPKASFNATNRSDCQPPLSTTFNNLSTGKQPLAYKWYFGDGDSSVAQNPQHTYSSAGVYNVMLIVTDTNNCKDTLLRNRYVSIGTTQADFTLPDTVCYGLSASFVNTSIGANTFNWSFANLGTSTAQNPTFTFNRSGIHQIKLVASAGPGCIDSITKPIYVDSISADFTLTFDSICDPQRVFMKDRSFGNKKSHYFKWTIPYNNYYSFNYDTSFIFPTKNCTYTNYIIRDSVVSHAGCVDIKYKTVKVYKEGIYVTTNAAACVPTTASFTQTNCLRFKPVRYHWNFGTGNAGDTSNLAQPTTTFNLTSSSSYAGFVTIWDSMGCKITQPISYSVGEKQKARFSWPKDTICFGDTLLIKNLSTDSSKITALVWQVGNDKPRTSWNYQYIGKQLGYVPITLQVYNRNCRTDTTILNTFWVSGPVVGTGFSSDCINRGSVQFYGSIYGGYNSFSWDFGDLSPKDTSNLNPLHLYGLGKYRAVFFAKNDTTGCKDSIVSNIAPTILKARIALNDTTKVCAGDTLQCDAQFSEGVFGLWYFWDFGDGTTDAFEVKPSKVYNNAGLFKIRLVVFNVDSCSDTTYKYVLVNKPEAKIFIPNPLCSLDTVFLRDSSIIQSALSFRSWNRDTSYLGNQDSLQVFSEFGLDTVFPPKNLRTDTLMINLKILDAQNCYSEVTENVIFREIRSDYNTQDSSLCRGDSIEFADTLVHIAGTRGTFYFGDGDSSVQWIDIHHYPLSGKYNTKHVVEGFGCLDTTVIPIEVQGIDSVGFWATLTDTTCYPATTFFNDVSIGDSIKWRIWDFGDGSVPVRSPLKDTLTKTYLTPGIYPVTLIVETSFGCVDSLTLNDYINVKGPIAFYSLTPDSVCTFEEVVFNVDSVNEYVQFLEWDFADGRLDSTDFTVKQKKHVYSTPGNLLTVLIYSDSTRTCTKFRSLPLVVEDVEAGFDILPDTIGCRPFEVSFQNTSKRGNRNSWKLESGTNSAVVSPQFIYKTIGTKTVELVHENTLNGCKDTVSKTLKVLDLPIVIANADTIICFSDSASLSARGAKSYVWTPSDFLNLPRNNKTGAAPPLDQLYTVVGSDSNGCASKDSALVRVIQEPLITLQSDTTIIIGEEFNMRVNHVNAATWKWTPSTGLSCDNCPNPKVYPTEDTRYLVTISDSLGCFEVERSIFVNVEQRFSVDVPDAFTPNGDGENDIIYPAGWGLQEIIEFKIFNRWGELVFESNPSTPGWDGYYKGELQNMDTYIYFVKGRGYDEVVYTKEGYITLLR